MIAIGKDFVLIGQIGPTRIDEIDTGQPVGLRDLLRTKMFFHRHRVVGATLHSGVIAHDHHLATGHPTDAGDDTGRRTVAIVEAVGREQPYLQKRRARVEQHCHV